MASTGRIDAVNIDIVCLRMLDCYIDLITIVKQTCLLSVLVLLVLYLYLDYYFIRRFDSGKMSHVRINGNTTSIKLSPEALLIDHPRSCVAPCY